MIGGLATVLALPIFSRLRALNDPADRIEADAAERETVPAVPVGVVVDLSASSGSADAIED